MSATESTPITSKSAPGNINGVDRLSSLCDELLHHIMSFLPMPEVVRTSLLSPRWHNLWASTPFIYIDHQNFTVENDYPYVDKDKLEKFGDHLLLLRDGVVCLDEARIYVTSCGCRKSGAWIYWAIKHKVRLLHISGFGYYPSALALERSLQTCPVFSNLTSLVLGDWCMAADLYPLLHILHCSPNLKELSVKLEMEECYFCTDHKSALLSSGATSSATEGYPSLKRIKICCRKDDPRVGALVQALLPIIIPQGKICIQRC